MYNLAFLVLIAHEVSGDWNAHPKTPTTGRWFGKWVIIPFLVGTHPRRSIVPLFYWLEIPVVPMPNGLNKCCLYIYILFVVYMFVLVGSHPVASWDRICVSILCKLFKSIRSAYCMPCLILISLKYLKIAHQLELHSTDWPGRHMEPQLWPFISYNWL